MANVDIFVGGTPSASSEYSLLYVIEFLFDKSLGTRWGSAAGPPAWAQYTLAAGVIKTAFETKFTPLAGRVKDFRIAGSSDNWVTEDILLSAQCPNVGTEQTFAIGSTAGYPSYRLYVDTYWGTSIVIIYEWVINGDDPPQPYEQEYSFFVGTLAEQFFNFYGGPAPKAEQEKQFAVGPAVKFEDFYEFFGKPSLKFEQLYIFNSVATKAYEQVYEFLLKAGTGIVEQEYRFIADSSLNERYEEMYNFYSSGGLISSAVTAGVSVIVDNVLMKAISVSGGRNGYYNLYEVVVVDNKDARSLAIGGPSAITWHSSQLLADGDVPVVDDVITLMLKAIKFSHAATDLGDNRTATLQLVSKTATLHLLPGPMGGLTYNTVWPAGTMSTVILDDLCLPMLPYTFDSIDFPLLQPLDGAGRYPIEIITELFPHLWIGPDDAGNLLLQDIFPVDAVGSGYDVDLQDNQYQITYSTDYPSLPLYNSVTVSTVAESASVVFPAPEIVEDEGDSSRAIAYGYRYPWYPFDLITTRTGCGDLVVTPGTEEIVELPPRRISFEDGTGAFGLPIYDLISVDWGCNVSLGTITPSGDGTLTCAVSGWSSAMITCRVKRMVFQITAYNRDDDIDFKLRDEDG